MEKILYVLYLSLIGTVYSVPTLRRAVVSAGGSEAFFEEYDENTAHILGLKPTPEGREKIRVSRNGERLEKTLEDCLRRGIRYVPETEEDYPKKLFDLPDRPFGLFVLGKLPDPDRPGVAVIGSRKCSVYGREAARFFGEAFAKAGLNVISGMAFGVDGHAGRGAAAFPGRSYAVLGNGPDICYPLENMDLYETLKRSGGILSERPPGYYPRSYDFPLRNRLISGLADAVAVMEAAENSGSLITVDHALEQNRAVFALPGRVTDRQSKGTNRLIREGAEILTCPEDLLQALGLNVSKDSARKARRELTKTEEAAFEALRQSEKTVDELVSVTGLPPSALLSALVGLEVKGEIRKKADGYYEVL